MPWTGVGVYVPVRFVASVAGAAGLADSVFAAAFLGGVFCEGFVDAAAFFLGTPFFAGGAAFFFMGRTLPQPPGGGQAVERGAPG